MLEESYTNQLYVVSDQRLTLNITEKKGGLQNSNIDSIILEIFPIHNTLLATTDNNKGKIVSKWMNNRYEQC